MASLVKIDDPQRIERFARRDPALHIYEIGDLDPFFWPHTTWFGLQGGDGELTALALLYTAQALPTLIALGRDDGGAIGDLASAVAQHLPERFYAHLSPGVLPRLGDRWTPKHHGRYLKMEHRDRGRLSGQRASTTEGVERLSTADREDLLALYSRSYPGNWFDARMLESGQYFGLRRDGTLVCVAGVHVYSPRYRVAALGNITTDPAWRGQGLARQATACLCRSLYENVDTIGLNVWSENSAAIACYKGLGFEEIGQYDEFMLG